MCDGMPASGRSGLANSRESTADENVPVPGPPLVKSSYFMRCRGQAPTGRHANPTLVGGSDDEAAGPNRCRQERLHQWRLESVESPCPGMYFGHR
jgi:hypothetical protein